MKRTDPASPSPLQPIWDLPTRLFHWLLVALIGFSWWSAENDQIDLHIWSGMAVLSLLLFRLLWGIFGSSTARFANFVRGPRAVGAYLAGQWSGVGHSPLGALSVVALLALTFVQVGLGLFSTDHDGLHFGPLSGLVGGDMSERLTDLHEALFNVLLAVIGVHVAAVIFYRFVRRQDIITPMIMGRGTVEPGLAPMRPGRWWAALLCLVVAIAVTRWLIAGAPPFGA